MEPDLTNNQKIVLQTLEKSEQPLGAYSILFNVEKKGIKSPQQVYRALDKLITIGAVHKIESLNSYIACKHKECKARESTSFLICQDCQRVFEILEADLSDKFLKVSKKSNFKYSTHNLEIFGVCKTCS
tara:strand:+ start:1215 stop:1601 length:387 start_codon:yes stop_codon:yes gene_type:complete